MEGEETHNCEHGCKIKSYLGDIIEAWGKLAPTLPPEAFGKNPFRDPKDKAHSDLYMVVDSELQYFQHWVETENNLYEPLDPIIKHVAINLISSAVDCLTYSTSGVTVCLDAIDQLMKL